MNNDILNNVDELCSYVSSRAAFRVRFVAYASVRVIVGIAVGIALLHSLLEKGHVRKDM